MHYQTVSNEMAASQNPIQGSLFGENEHNNINEAEKLNSSEPSNENLSHQQLKEDASLRPRIKQTAKNPNQIIDLDEFSRCLLYTSPSPRDQRGSRMPSSA